MTIKLEIPEVIEGYDLEDLTVGTLEAIQPSRFSGAPGTRVSIPWRYARKEREVNGTGVTRRL